MQWRSKWIAVPLALAFVAGGCGDDDEDILGPGEFALEDFVGSWRVTAVEYTKDGDADTRVDVAETAGVNISAQVGADGTYVVTYDFGGSIPDATETGIIEVEDGNVLFDGESLDARLSGTTLTLTDETVTYDFDNDPGTTEEGADLVMVWQKQGAD